MPLCIYLFKQNVSTQIHWHAKKWKNKKNWHPIHHKHRRWTNTIFCVVIHSSIERKKKRLYLCIFAFYFRYASVNMSWMMMKSSIRHRVNDFRFSNYWKWIIFSVCFKSTSWNRFELFVFDSNAIIQKQK